MKTLMLTTAMLLITSTAIFAQCDQKLLFTSSKTEHLNDAGILQKTVDETAKVETNKNSLVITVHDDHVMEGTIKSDSCGWKVPYREGKSIIKASLTEQGEEKNVTITITGRDGKVTLLFEMEGVVDDKIRVTADKFEEVK